MRGFSDGNKTKKDRPGGRRCNTLPPASGGGALPISYFIALGGRGTDRTHLLHYGVEGVPLDLRWARLGRGTAAGRPS